MKNLTLRMLALILGITFFGTGCQQNGGGENTSDALASQAENEKSIQTIITSETDAYAKRDSARLISYYTDDTITQSAWNNLDGTFGRYKGIDVIRKSFGEAFRNNAEPEILPAIGRSDWFFRPLGEGWMWVSFLQKITLLDGKIYQSHETRIMKLEDATWKIAVMYTLSDHGIKKEN